MEAGACVREGEGVERVAEGGLKDTGRKEV